jgi:polyisoprenyl-teichoic acid--peptidoglycan teichoic acid transferase
METEARVQARRIRPDTGAMDRRRLAAATLSAVLPGLGQAFNRRRQLTILFLVPSLVILAIALLMTQFQSPVRLAAWVITPSVLGTLLTLNVLVLAWRLVAAFQAFLDTRWTGPTGRLGVIGMVVIALVIVAPHLVVFQYGRLFGDTFSTIFTGQVLAARSDDRPTRPGPADGQRINVLIVGVDSTATRHATLTDTMIVASLDPVGGSVSMVSLPRDLVGVPLGNGDTYAPKLNSLMSYADRHPKAFPNGGLWALQDAASALLGIPIHYYATMDMAGFIDMIDAVGGVNIVVKRGFEDPTYDGYGTDKRGFSITAGPHHLDGIEALAYARSRKARGESDFTRAARQQEILAALRHEAMSGGSMFWQLPALLEAVGASVRTDLPTERLPALAAILDESGNDSMVRVVIKHPLVHPKPTKYGDGQDPDLAAILAMAAELFPAPGATPVEWPTPSPSAAP